PLKVAIAGGKSLTSNNMCSKFTWSLQGEKFTTSVMLLPLGGCKMVLGIQWLSTLGDINCNFKDLRMSFKYNNKLKGKEHHETSSTLLGLTLLLQEFEDVFAVPTSFPRNKSHDHRIPLKEGTQLVNIRPYRHPPTHKDAIKVMVKELLDAGLKNNTIKDKFPIPLIEELIDELHGSVIYSKLDLRLGFVKGYAIISHPLNALLKKNPYKWSEATQQAFEGLKLAMSQTSVLKLPNFNEPFVVETDAYSIGIGVVLQKGGHPIAYMSKALAPKHHSLSTYEKEFLAVIQAYDYDIVYKRGSQNIPADALSRIPNTSELLQLTSSTFSSKLYEKIKEGWTKDSEL
nr:hypothetical protein [Tanacetum cinerariifolium]